MLDHVLCILKDVFGYDVFRGNQVAIIECVVVGDVCFEEDYRDWETDRKSTRLNSSHEIPSRMPSSA